MIIFKISIKDLRISIVEIFVSQNISPSVNNQKITYLSKKFVEDVTPLISINFLTNQHIFISNFVEQIDLLILIKIVVLYSTEINKVS